MPELLEVEIYRRLADSVVGATVQGVAAHDHWYLKGTTSARLLQRELVGATVVGTHRIGKLLLLSFGERPVLGLRFGMTGRLIVGGTAAIDYLEYSSARDEPAWDRFVLRFADGTDLRMRDPRRLGGVELNPSTDHLGPDALTVTPSQLRMALLGAAAPLKACLLDQRRLAGVGNLLADETLWRAALDPARRGGSLTLAEHRRLHRHLRITLPELLDRGGSHMGDLHHARVRGGRCPRDGVELLRRTIGGRTTYSCPRHQH